MTEIEKKALALVNEVLAEWGVMKNAVEVPKNSNAFARALLRAIEQNEADKAAHAATIEGILKSHKAYKQEVSDAVDDTKFMVETHCDTEALALVSNRLNRFIIPKPDPLVEVFMEAQHLDADAALCLALHTREALAKRGFKIVEDV